MRKCLATGFLLALGGLLVIGSLAAESAKLESCTVIGAGRLATVHPLVLVVLHGPGFDIPVKLFLVLEPPERGPAPRIGITSAPSTTAFA